MKAVSDADFKVMTDLMTCAMLAGCDARGIAEVVSAEAVRVWREKQNPRSFEPYKPKYPPESYTPALPQKEWWALCAQIYQRDGYVCAYCGDTNGPFAIDHIHPVSRGGSHDPDNLTVACRTCNSGKCDRLLSEWRGQSCQ